MNAVSIAGNWGRNIWQKRPTTLALLLFYIAYVLAGGFSQGLAIIPGVSIVFWPPSGIFAAALLINSRRNWPFWIVTGCLAELTCNAIWFHSAVTLALIYFTANALMAMTAASLISKFTGKSFRLESPSEVVALIVLGAGVAPIVSATLIAATVEWIGKTPFQTAWPLVWLGDGSGLLISMPLTLVAVELWQNRAKTGTQQLSLAAGFCIALLVIAVLAFHGHLPTLYLTLPLLLWIAAVYQFKGAAVALGGITLMAALFTSKQIGIYAGDPALLYEKVVALQAFLAVSAILALVVASLAYQRPRLNQEPLWVPASSNLFEPSSVAFSAISGLLVVALGIIVFIGWLAGVEAVKSIGTSFAAMKVNTALCFIALGIALASFSRADTGEYVNTFAIGASVFALAVSMATFAEYAFGVNSGLDQILFRDDAMAVHPGRMSPATAGAFFVASIALLIPRLVADQFNTQSLLWSMVLIVAAAAILGNANDVEALYKIGIYSGMAMHTAVGFAVLALGGLSLTLPRKKIGDILAVSAVSNGAGCYFFAAAVVMFSTWLRYVLGELAGLSLSFVTYYPAVILVALLTGWRAGIFATLISSIIASFYFISPAGITSLNSGDLTGIIIFVLTGITVSYFADQWIKLYDRTIVERNNLDQLVDERTAELHQANRQLKMAMSAASMTAWHYAPGSGAVTLSDNAAEALDLPKPDAIRIADDGYALIHSDDRENHRSKVDGALAEMGSYTDQFRHVHSGKIIWMEEHAQAVVNPDTQAVELVGITANISERKRAEDKLRESENFSRSVLEASPDCVKVMGPDGNVEFMNGHGQILLEIDDFSGSKGQSWTSFWPQETQAVIENALNAARRGDESRFEAFCPTFKGSPKWWDVSVKAIVDSEGHCTRIVSVSRDITMRKQSEKALKTNLERLEAAEYATNALNYDTRGGTVWRGPGLTRILGWQHNEIPLTIGGWLSLLHPDDLPNALSVYDIKSANIAYDVVEHGLGDGENRYALEYRTRHKDGHYVWLMDRGRTERDAAGKITGMVGARYDVTSRKETEQALRKSQSNLAAVFDALPLGIALLDVDGAPVIANDGFKRFVPEVIPSHNPAVYEQWKAYHPDGQRLERKDFPGARALRGERVWPGQEFLFFGDQQEAPIWTRVAAVPILDQTGQTVGATAVIANVDIEKRASDGLRDSEARFTRAGELARFGAYSFDVAAQRGMWSPGFWSMMGRQDILEVSLTTFMDFVHPDDRTRVSEHMSTVLNKIEPYEAEYRLTSSDGAEIWVMDRGEATGPLDQKTGLALRTSGMVLDITERKRNEQHQTLLMNELNHRVKNTLATVQSMASQTLRYSPSLAAAKISFEARLMSLSKVHDVLTREKWESAPLADIVDRAIIPYCGASPDRFTVKGPEIKISARLALAFAMTLHELCTNAVKYGALLNDTGMVEITWSISKSKNSASILKFRWSEKNGPPVVPPTTKGFGTKLIERSLASDFGGDVKINFAKSGVTCIIKTALIHPIE